MKNKENKYNQKGQYFINSIKTGTDIKIQEDLINVNKVLNDILNKRKEYKNNKLNK